MARKPRLVRQFIRKLDRFRPVRPLVLPGLVNHWTYSYSDDSAVRVWVFAGLDRDEVLVALADVTDVDGWSVSSVHDCSGESFAGPVHLVEQRGRIWVRQCVGVDV